MEPGYPCPDAVSVNTCDEVATMSERGVECTTGGRGTIPLKGHLEPLLFGGGITQDEIAHQPGSQTNFDGRSEARDISLIRGNARQRSARPSVPLNYDHLCSVVAVLGCQRRCQCGSRLVLA